MTESWPFVLTLIVVVSLVFAASCGLTLGVRRYAIRSSLLDIPNDRSSHSRPTPRGGGVAVVVAWGLALGLLTAGGIVDPWVGLALLGGGAAIALVGWADDCRRLSARVRAAVHFLAAGWAVWCLGGLPSVLVGAHVLSIGWLGSLLAVVGVVWLTNLYNFMDGIDGLAAGEAVCVGLVGGVLLLAAGAHGLGAATLALAAAAGGFLVFNWPPAKIFMGDVGSGLLGYAFGVLALASERAGAVPLMVWLLLLAVFLVDATATLIRRMLAGERWYEAHRSHAYQLAVRAGYSHRHVTLTISGINVLLASAAVGVWVAPRLFPFLSLLTIALLAGLWYLVSRHPFAGAITTH